MPVSVLLLVFSLFFSLVEGPVRAATFTDTTDADFAQGIHENTENVNGDLRLQAGKTKGKFTSRVFDGGGAAVWGTLSWDATLPTLLNPTENDNVGSEPLTLVDGTKRIGTVTGGSLLNVRVADGVYESIGEENVGPVENRYVGAEVVYEGRTSGIENAQNDDGKYENVCEVLCYENIYPIVNWDFSNTGSTVWSTTVTPGTATFTFGENRTGSYDDDSSANRLVGSWFVAPEDGKVTSISLYIINWDNEKFACAIYGPDGTLVGYTEELWISTDFNGNWEKFDISFGGEVRGGIPYWLLVWGNSRFYYRYFGDAADNKLGYKNNVSYNYPNFPNPLGSLSGLDDRRMSIYATCTATLGTGTYGYTTSDGIPPPSYYHRATSTKYRAADVTFVTEQSFSYTDGTPLSASLTWSYRLTGNSIGTGDNLSVTLVLPNGTEVLLDNVILNEATDWTTRSLGLSVANFSQKGTYKLRLRSRLRTAASGTSNYIQACWDNVSLRIERPVGHRFDVQHTLEVPPEMGYKLEVKYYTSGDSEPVSLYLYNFSTARWDNLGNLQAGGSAGSPLSFSRDLTGTGYVSDSGEVWVRYVQPDNDNVPTSLMIEYTRVRCRMEYALRWEHRIENVAVGKEGYRIRVKGKTSGDGENVGVYIWNNSAGLWELVGNLSQVETTLTKYIPGSEIGKYLNGTTVSVLYKDANSVDNLQTVLHVDLCILEQGPLSKSYLKFQIGVSQDGNNWENVGPDGTSGTYFESSPASLENVPERRYLRYIAYLSSDSPELSGENGPRVHQVSILSSGQATVFTGEAKDVTWNSAVLTARVLYTDPSALVWFRYRKVGESQWTTTPRQGWMESHYWYRVTGLQENTWYEFEVQVRWGGENFGGGIKKFKTLPSKPYAITLKASEVDNSSALLNARIYYGNYDNVGIRFWYRPEGGNWSATPLIQGYRGLTYSFRITGLTANKLYYFKAEITYGTTSENANEETFTTFSSKLMGMKYNGAIGTGSSPAGWHGVRIENLPSSKGLKLELLTLSSSTYYSLRVVRENGDLLYAGHFLSDNGKVNIVSLRFQRNVVAGENVYVELYDPYGFAYRTKGTENSMGFTRGGVRYAYSYLDRAGKNLRYYDRACGVNVLEVYT
ncbi:MAG: fibronectin type III domain-containing protein [Candidatus Hadarchaeales archaeon]